MWPISWMPGWGFHCKLIKEGIFKVCEEVLNYAQVAIGNDTQYKKYRSIVLRRVNDFIRDIDSGRYDRK